MTVSESWVESWWSKALHFQLKALDIRTSGPRQPAGIRISETGGARSLFCGGFLKVWLEWIYCKMVSFFFLPDDNVKAGVHQGHRCTLGSAHA